MSIWSQVAEWLYNLSKIDNNEKLNIHALGEYAFMWSPCNHHKDVAEWLCTLHNIYCIKYENDKMIPYIRNIKTIIEDNAEEIEKLLGKPESIEFNEDCMICLSNASLYWIKLDCNYIICSNCFIHILINVRINVTI